MTDNDLESKSDTFLSLKDVLTAPFKAVACDVQDFWISMRDQGSFIAEELKERFTEGPPSDDENTPL